MSWMDDPINEKPVFRNGKVRFSRVEVDVYPRGGTCKHIAECGKSKRRVVIRICQHMEDWFFKPLWSNGSSHTD